MRTIREFEERLHTRVRHRRDPGLRPPLRGRGGDRRRRLRAPGPPTTTSPARTAATATRSPRAATCTAMMAEIYGKRDRPLPRQGRLDAHRRPRRRACSAPTGSSAAARRSSAASALTAKVTRHRPGRASPSPATAAPTRARSSRASTSPRPGTCPCVFVVENNGYAESTSSSFHQSGVDVVKRADGFGLPGVSRRRLRLLRRARGGRRGDRARALRAAGRRSSSARACATSATSRATSRPTAAPDEVEEVRAHARLPGRLLRGA